MILSDSTTALILIRTRVDKQRHTTMAARTTAAIKLKDMITKAKDSNSAVAEEAPAPIETKPAKATAAKAPKATAAKAPKSTAAKAPKTTAPKAAEPKVVAPVEEGPELSLDDALMSLAKIGTLNTAQKNELRKALGSFASLSNAATKIASAVEQVSAVRSTKSAAHSLDASLVQLLSTLDLGPSYNAVKSGRSTNYEAADPLSEVLSGLSGDSPVSSKEVLSTLAKFICAQQGLANGEKGGREGFATDLHTIPESWTVIIEAIDAHNKAAKDESKKLDAASISHTDLGKVFHSFLGSAITDESLVESQARCDKDLATLSLVLKKYAAEKAAAKK